MILAANCENCLASGVIAYNLDLQANQSIKLYFEITHAPSFLTPLSFPINKINPTIIQKAALNDSQSFSPAIELPNHTFKLTQLSGIKSSIEIAMQNYLLTITKNHANLSLPSLYFNLTSVLSCGAHESFAYIIDHYLSNHKTYYTPSFLLEQQHHLFCLTTILTAHHTYRLSNHALQERLLKKIHLINKARSFF